MRQKRLANCTRAQFMLALENVGDHRFRRCVRENQVENLGLFVLDCGASTWIVQGYSGGEAHYWHVRPIKQAPRVAVTYAGTDPPPWKNWNGGMSDINRGDNPTQYAAWRRQALDHGERQ